CTRSTTIRSGSTSTPPIPTPTWAAFPCRTGTGNPSGTTPSERCICRGSTPTCSGPTASGWAWPRTRSWHRCVKWERRRDVADLVGVFAASHTPVMLNFPDAAGDEERESVFAGFHEVGRRLTDARPEAVIVLSTDHLHNFFLDNL